MCTHVGKWAFWGVDRRGSESNFKDRRSGPKQEIGEEEKAKEKDGSRRPLEEEVFPRLCFRSFWPGAEPFVKDALAIFSQYKKGGCKQ